MHCIVIKKGKYFHYTYSSVRWNRWGSPTPYDVITCDTWKEGFKKVQHKNLVLFIDSGTVFNDIEDFLKRLQSYPHQGLVGHIIDPLDKDKFYSLHPQCFLIDVSEFSCDMFDDGEFIVPPSRRSEKNIHDNYTPLWLCPVEGKSKTSVQTDFGQKMIAHQIARGKIVSNWHQTLRDNKIFLYRDAVKGIWIDSQRPYLELAETHLWVLNNQVLKPLRKKHIVCPASGLFWMLGVNPQTIDLVDISQHQLDLAKSLATTWDGTDYGSFVYDFIVRHRIRNIQLDVGMTDADKKQLILHKENFVYYVNDKFIKQLADFDMSAEDFKLHWQNIGNKKISYHNTNIIDWLLTAQLSPESGVWLSNILEYKYTWIKSDETDVQRCLDTLSQIGCQVEK